MNWHINHRLCPTKCYCLSFNKRLASACMRFHAAWTWCNSTWVPPTAKRRVYMPDSSCSRRHALCNHYVSGLPAIMLLRVSKPFVPLLSLMYCIPTVQLLRSPHMSYAFIMARDFCFQNLSQKTFHNLIYCQLSEPSNIFGVYCVSNKDVAFSVQSFYKLWIQSAAVDLATSRSSEAEADQWKICRYYHLHLKRQPFQSENST
jgi:hypothetical protein